MHVAAWSERRAQAWRRYIRQDNLPASHSYTFPEFIRRIVLSNNYHRRAAVANRPVSTTMSHAALNFAISCGVGLSSRANRRAILQVAGEGFRAAADRIYSVRGCARRREPGAEVTQRPQRAQDAAAAARRTISRGRARHRRPVTQGKPFTVSA